MSKNSMFLIVVGLVVVALLFFSLKSGFGGSTGSAILKSAVVKDHVRCTETDAGDWYKKRGEVKGYNAKGIVTGSYLDYCVDEQGQKQSRGPRVMEYYCDKSGKIQTHEYLCVPSTCSAGKCKKATLVS